MFANTIYESLNFGSPMVGIAVLRHNMRMLCYNVDDFTDAARVAVSPVLLTMRLVCRQSLKPMKVISPNGIHGRLHSEGHEIHPKLLLQVFE